MSGILRIQISWQPPIPQDGHAHYRQRIPPTFPASSWVRHRLACGIKGDATNLFPVIGGLRLPNLLPVRLGPIK